MKLPLRLRFMTFVVIVLALIVAPQRIVAQDQPTPPTLWELAWNRTGTRLAGASSDGNVYIWDQTGHLLRTLSGNAGIVNSVSWSPNDNDIVAEGTSDGSLILWNVESGLMIHRLDATNFSYEWSPGIFVIRWSPDGSKIIAAGMDVFQIWETTHWTSTTETITGTLFDMQWSSDGTFILAAGIYDMLRLDLEPFKISTETDQSWYPVGAFSWHPDGQTFVAVGRTRPQMSLWTVSPLSQTGVVQLSGLATAVESLDAAHVAVALQSGEVLVLNPQTGQITDSFSTGSELHTLAWNPAYGLLAAGGDSTGQAGQGNGLLGLVQPLPIPTPQATAALSASGG